MTKLTPNTPRAVEKDLKTLALFIEIYCHANHAAQVTTEVALKTHDVQGVSGKAITLCPDCTKLLTHAFVKRSRCPLDPKPMCKHCPSHCYAPAYRTKIQEVMRFSGRHMVLSGRVDYLLHLLF